MTRCECTGTPFDEVVRRLRAGQSLDQAQAETGAGLLCSACVPDLRERVAVLQAGEDEATEPASTEAPAA